MSCRLARWGAIHVLLVLGVVGPGCPAEDPAGEDGGTLAEVEDGGSLAFGDWGPDPQDGREPDPDGGGGETPPPGKLPSVAPHPVLVLPDADAHVQSGSGASKSLGTATQLWIDQDLDGNVNQAYLRFTVPKVEVARAVLRLYVAQGSSNSFDVTTVSSTTWGESITWNSKPAVDGKIVASLLETTPGAWVEIDVTAQASPGSALSLALVPRSANGVGISSREAPTHRPRLVVDVGADAPPNAIQPEVDAMVRSGTFAGQSFGKWTFLDVDGDAEGTVKQAFLRFKVGALTSLRRATLRLYLIDGSANSATVVSIADHGWTDSITWDTRPTTTGTALGSISFTARGWVELDVTPAVKAGAPLSLAVLPSSTDGIRIASMEAPYYRPLLVITQGNPTCGDGRCDQAETCRGCPADCGACPAGCLYGELFPMRGDMHAHTSYSDGGKPVTGDGAALPPSSAFPMARSNKLDFLIITDHLVSLTSTELSSCLGAAKAAEVAGSFVASCGWENKLGDNALGHANVFFGTSITQVPNTADYATWFSKLGACTGCLGQVNHPASVSFTWANYNTKPSGNLALQEFNGSSDFAAGVAKLAAALDKGYRVSPTWNSDTHKANWGASPRRSGFWVTALSAAGLTEAIRERRSFASSDKDAALRLRAGRCGPGSDLSAASLETVEVLATDPADGFDRIVLVGKGNKTLRTFPCAGQKVCGGTTRVQITEANHLVAFAVQKDGDAIVASPIWLRP